jgi:NAD-dependent SIR2 family protein deacetylase
MDYKCEDCDKIYKNKNSLQKHIKLKHSTVQSVQCVKCDKHFLNDYLLKEHLRHVHPSKLHSCSFCGSSFKASWI